MNRLILNRRYWLLPPLLWAMVVGLSLMWNWRTIDDHLAELSLQRGRFVFKVVESVRLWNARHGGVYAPINDWTPPNPYLEVPERDIATPAGKKLTLINPAYMTRQLATTISELSGISTHLTSLKPLNPRNKPDAWEREALLAFDRGEMERFEFLPRKGGNTIARYIAPLRTQTACLKCHWKQGYKVGDVRGGLSVTFCADELIGVENQHKRRHLLVHAIAWLLLSGLTLVAAKRIRENMLSLKAAKEEEERTVERRTAELVKEVREREETEARMRLLLESSGGGIFGVDLDGVITFVNPRALQMLGYAAPEELLGRAAETVLHTPADGAPQPPDRCILCEPLLMGMAIHRDEDLFWRADGSSFPVEYRAHPLVLQGEITGAVVTFDDITERKQRESDLRKLYKAVEHSPESVIITDAEGRVEYVNRKFLETTGFSLSEVIGHKPSLLKSGCTKPEVYEDLWKAITSGRVWQGVLLNRKRDGTLFWEEESISPILDDQGRITHFVGVQEDITERRQMEEKVWHQANFDALTELPNRTLFYDRLHQAIARAERESVPVGLMFIDLDRFKEVNDTLGHEAGDALLVEAAQRLMNGVRRSDTVARMGGDEFTVILPDLNEGRAALAHVADKMLAELSAPFTLHDKEIAISASIGIVCYPRDGRTISDLLKNADTAMYQAKEKGRARYVFFTGEEPRAERECGAGSAE